jgi:hypothetical protein
MVEWLVKNELERMWKELTVAELEVLSQTFDWRD